MKFSHILPLAVGSSALVLGSHSVLNNVDGIQTTIEDKIQSFHDWAEELSHHKKPSLTVYQKLEQSKQTKTFLKLVNKFDDLVEVLNSTDSGSYTLFVPTDDAFARIPKEYLDFSKEVLKGVLAYHVVTEFLPLERVLKSRTAPTLFRVNTLSDSWESQRLAFIVNTKGVLINFASYVTSTNHFASNGVIHTVENVLLPPPNAVALINSLPLEYSTLELGLIKTGLLDILNSTGRNGGTFFAPTNAAWQELGHVAVAELFSWWGLPYLKALLEYHIVPDVTIYSDVLYKKGQHDENDMSAAADTDGYYHLEVKTLLQHRKLSVDVARLGSYTSIRANGFAKVIAFDGVAADGVVQQVDGVILPPKVLASGTVDEFYHGGPITFEELKERLEPFVDPVDVKFDL